MDIQGLPVNPVEHKMSEEELVAEFGENGWNELEDEVHRCYSFTPMKVEIEEHHVGVYNSKRDNIFKKVDYPAYLLRNSLVSPSFLVGVRNAKNINAAPLYRQEQEFERMGLDIDRADMVHWTILYAERYLSIFYYYHVLQADETPFQVLHELGRPAQIKSYMWLFRSGEDGELPIILYKYPETRAGDNAANFLHGFKGYLMCDGYSGHNKVPDAKRTACWAHIRRYLTDAIPKGKALDYTQPSVQGICTLTNSSIWKMNVAVFLIISAYPYIIFILIFYRKSHNVVSLSKKDEDNKSSQTTKFNKFVFIVSAQF